MHSLRKVFRDVGDLIYPPDSACALCGKEENLTESLCSQCRDAMKRHSGLLCPACGREVSTDGYCNRCRKIKRPYQRGAVVYHYEGIVRDALHKLKFDGEKHIARLFATAMTDVLTELGWRVDVLVPVPSSRLRMLNRGFNPPGLMTKHMAVRMNLPCLYHALRRRYARPMFRQSAEERLNTAFSSYALYRCEGITSKRVLLVDDITTTGATLHACASLLLKGGAAEVYVLAASGVSLDIRDNLA